MKNVEKVSKKLTSKEVTPSATPKKDAKSSKTVQETPVKQEPMTRIQAVGVVMRENPSLTPAEIIKTADKLYNAKTGKPLNPKETKTQVAHAINFLNGYNPKP